MCTVQNIQSLQRALKTAQYIIGTGLPSIRDIGERKCGTYESFNFFFSFLPSGILIFNFGPVDCIIVVSVFLVCYPIKVCIIFFRGV